MALPVNAVPAGGFGMEADRLRNALTEQRLKNQYYGQNIESEINNRNALTQGQTIENKYMPEKLRLANENQKNVNAFYEPNIKSEMNYRNSQTNKNNIMTPLEATNQKNINDWYARKAQADIDASKALSSYRALGGNGGGTGGKEEMMFQNLVSKDNPQLGNDPQKVYEASNVLRQGGDKLSDGTVLNPISPAARESFNRLTKAGTTSPILTGNIRANQADAELTVLNDYAQKGLEPYGTTYLNKSAAQIMDSFKSDPESQKKLGRFIASQALQYESAQNRIRLANGQPGVTATEELMRISGQQVDAKFPRLSYAARQEAAAFLDKALREGLKARQSVGIGASETTGGNGKKTENPNSDISSMSDEELRKIAGGG